MRARIAVAVLAAAAVSCGPSPDERLRQGVATECGPVVDAFVAELDGGRLEAALARTTRAFQGAAAGESMRAVLESQRRALGASRSRTVREVESVVAEGDPPRAREAVVVLDATYERGRAVLRTRVQRDPARGDWLVDGHEARTDLFTWTYRK
jgi:hypothetical protein